MARSVSYQSLSASSIRITDSPHFLPSSLSTSTTLRRRRRVRPLSLSTPVPVSHRCIPPKLRVMRAKERKDDHRSLFPLLSLSRSCSPEKRADGPVPSTANQSPPLRRPRRKMSTLLSGPRARHSRQSTASTAPRRSGDDSSSSMPTLLRRTLVRPSGWLASSLVVAYENISLTRRGRAQTRSPCSRPPTEASPSNGLRMTSNPRLLP